MNIFRYNTEPFPATSLKEAIRQSYGKFDAYADDAITEWFNSRLVMRSPLNARPAKASFWWRVTIPVFFTTWMLLAFIVLPIRWIFTGKYYMDEKDSMLSLFKAWRTRIFPVR